jgi:hypothetical protein
MNSYQERQNAERLARQAPPLQIAAKDILEQLKSIEQYVYWAFDPSEKDGGAYWAQSLLEHAHELIDQAHAFKIALAANPPPKEEDDAA